MPELLISTALLLGVSGVVMSGVMQISLTEATISNRTQMHSSVRAATELLQQEIGQAGRVSLPSNNVTLTGPVTVTGVPSIVGVSSTSNMFVGQKLVIDTGDDGTSQHNKKEETVTVTAVDLVNNTITATFNITHASGARVRPEGAFSSGVVPTNVPNGSTGSVLKLYGDINDDGNMVYVEYTCDTQGGNLYRNAMPITATSKPALTSSMILLPNIKPNPDGTPCFLYQQKTVSGSTYVINVAVTLTVETELRDAKTRQLHQETKALLNVSPRNVFQAWQMASGQVNNRVQPMPPSVANLLP